MGLDDEHLLCVIQLEVELHLLVEDIISSISADAYENSFLMWPWFSPFCSHLGRIVVVWCTSTLHGTLLACIMWFHDVFVISKCIWQICKVLQIYDWTLGSNFGVREYEDWMSMTILISRHYLWYESPPNTENVLILNVISVRAITNFPDGSFRYLWLTDK